MKQYVMIMEWISNINDECNKLPELWLFFRAKKKKPTNQPNTQIKSQSLVSRHTVGYKYTEELEPKT